MEREHAVKLQVTEKAKSQFGDICMTQSDGCRGFDRLVERLITLPVMEQIATHSRIQTLRLTAFKDDRLILEIEKSEAH
jgi:ATP-dependent Clp protease ATP-binding subunit ClpA